MELEGGHEEGISSTKGIQVREAKGWMGVESVWGFNSNYLREGRVLHMEPLNGDAL